MKIKWQIPSISFFGIFDTLYLFTILFVSLGVITHLDNVIHTEWIKLAAFIGYFVILFFTITYNQNTNKKSSVDCLYNFRNGNATIDLSGAVSPMPTLRVKNFLRVLRDGKILTVILSDDYEILDILQLVKLKDHTLIDNTKKNNKHILRILIGKNNKYDVRLCNKELELDVSHFDSPLPEIMTKKLLNILRNGKILTVISKEYSQTDIISLINNSVGSYTLIEKTEKEGQFILKILVKTN